MIVNRAGDGRGSGPDRREEVSLNPPFLDIEGNSEIE